MKSPAFQWYPTDYLGSMRVQMMTCEEEGIYIRLLCYCWQHGHIPNDRERLRRLIAKPCTDSALDSAMSMFRKRGDNLVHERLEAERRKQENFREVMSRSGKKGGNPAFKRGMQNPYYQQRDKPPDKPTHKPDISSSSPISDLQSSAPASEQDARAENVPRGTPRGANEREIEQLPTSLQTPEFIAAWEKWLVHWSERYGRGQSMPFHTAHAHIKICLDLGPLKAIEAIETAITQDLRKPSPPLPANGRTRQHPSNGNAPDDDEPLPRKLGVLPYDPRDAAAYKTLYDK